MIYTLVIVKIQNSVNQTKITVFNYKQIVQSIKLDEGQLLNDDLCPCYCENSEFCEPDYDHIITGGMHLIKNKKLRRLLTMGFNFRQPWCLKKKLIMLLKNFLEV